MLAIIIPYYKISFFKATLDSLVNQTNQEFKVYIGDDASPENLDSLLEDFKELLNFKYHRFENNLGGQSLTNQWKRCIDLIQDEDWIMILGDDDVLNPNVVETFYYNLKEIENEKIKVIRFATEVINEDGLSISHKYEHPRLQKAADSYYDHFSKQTRSSLSEYIFSRKSYDLYGFTDYPLGWHSDDKAWLEFSEFGNVFSINNSLIKIRITDQSISGQNENFKLKRFSKMKFLESLIEKHFSFFSSKQKKAFLFEYGILIKEFDEKSISKVVRVFFSFLKIGYFYDAFRFLRRMYIIKQ
jgi:glycosyltransferase involved in cell wall biosynthesis